MEENNNKKRILHVIRVVYDILSALFIVFVSSALVINAVSRGDKQKQDILTPNIQEVKARQNYYRNPSGYYYYGSADFLSDYFIRNWIQYLVNNGEEWASETSTNTGTYTNDLWRGDGISPISVSVYDNTSQTATTDFSVRAVTFKKNVWGNSYYYDFQLNNSDGTIWINFQFTLVKLADVSGLWNFGVEIVRRGATATAQKLIITENSASSKSLFWPIFYEIENGGYENGYENGYNAGHQIGYNEGYEEGYDSVDQATIYQNGYGTGYNQGFIDGSEGIESNVFVVIGQAFGSVAQVFSVELLPGLPLWILVFTPLIISVVIVVVKMIKG